MLAADLPVACAAVCAAVAGAGGLLVPRLVAWIPEPEPEPEPAREERPKEPYADIAALPGLRWKAALASAVAGAVIGGALGWSWALLYLLVLCPVGVALGVIDLRVHLLPTKVIAPTYYVTIALLLVAAVAAHDLAALRSAAVGCALYGAFFLLLWFFSRGALGYGDVRLSGVLGIALGSLGFAPFFVGMVGGVLLGGVASIVTLAVRGRGTEFAYGPYMLAGVLLGVVLGPAYAAHLAGG